MARRVRAEAPSLHRVAIRVSPHERVMILSAARVNHQRPIEFMRDAITSAAGECLEIDDSTKPTKRNRLP